MHCCQIYGKVFVWIAFQLNCMQHFYLSYNFFFTESWYAHIYLTQIWGFTWNFKIISCFQLHFQWIPRAFVSVLFFYFFESFLSVFLLYYLCDVFNYKFYFSSPSQVFFPRNMIYSQVFTTNDLMTARATSMDHIEKNPSIN